MGNSNINTITCNSKITDEISMTINIEGVSSSVEYRSFCDKLKSDNSLNELSDEEKSKLFLLVSLMTPSFLNNLIKGRSEVVIPTECGTLTLRGLGKFDSLLIKGNGEETWRRENRIASVQSVYDLNLRQSKSKMFNADFIYNFLMNFRPDMKWTQNPKVAEIISACISDITEKVCKDKYTNEITIRYIGNIDWQRLKTEIKDEYGATIKVRRSGKSDIWNIYISILDLIFKNDVQKIVRFHQSIRKGNWIDGSLSSLLNDINHKFNIEVKEWQIKGMTKRPLSNQNMYDALIDIVRSKVKIFSFPTTNR